MPDHPSGTITFLFTDVQGSTGLWEHQRAWMEQAHARHEAILRAAIAAQGGWAYKQIGDAFQAAFATADAALAAAVAAQRALAAEPWGEPGPLTVRMALHTGTAEERADDYVGPLLNRVARLLNAGHGGQILLTGVTAALVRDALPPDLALEDCGARRLKDLIVPEHVWQVTGAGLPDGFPPLRTLDAQPNNLPPQPTAFIGREVQLAAVDGLLRRSDVRLVTLTGPGGTGKTRLALQAAADLLDAFPHGCWLVELAALADSAPRARNHSRHLRAAVGRRPDLRRRPGELPARPPPVVGARQLRAGAAGGRSGRPAVARRARAESAGHQPRSAPPLRRDRVRRAPAGRARARRHGPLQRRARRPGRPRPGGGAEPVRGGAPLHRARRRRQGRLRRDECHRPGRRRESACGSTGCRWPSSSPPRGSSSSRRRPCSRGSTAGWPCSPAGRATCRRASRHCARPSPGATTCSTPRNNSSSAALRSFREAPPWRRCGGRRGRRRARRGHGAGRPQPAAAAGGARRCAAVLDAGDDP